MPKLTHAGVSHVGMKRTQNQDSFLLVPEVGLFIIADGMGGHRGGEVASKLAVTTISEYFKSEDNDSLSPQDRLKKAIQLANDAIQKKSQEDSSLLGMGTTTTALLFTTDQLFIGHVGDSRCYLVRKSSSEPKIWQLTQDHSLVQEKLKAGIISREQLKTDKLKHVLTRSVGVETQVEVDTYQYQYEPGDVFVTCSDGLSGMLSDSEIRDTVSKTVFHTNGETNSVQKAAENLIESANQHGGEDNVTAVVVLAQ